MTAQQEHGLSRRRACRLIGISRSVAERAPKRERDHARLRERLHALAGERRRFGYRRLHELLRREGFVANHKLVHRLYQEEKLALRRRDRQKRGLGGAMAGSWCPIAANQRWSLDFTEDCLAKGRKFRTANLKAWGRTVAAGRVSRLNARASARRSWSTSRWRGSGWSACSRTSPASGATPTCWSWTTSYVRERWAAPGKGSPFASVAAGVDRRQPSGAASALAGKILSHSEHRIQRRRAVVLTVLYTRCRSERKTRSLSTGSRTRPHGPSQKGVLPLGTAPASTKGR